MTEQKQQPKKPNNPQSSLNQKPAQHWQSIMGDEAYSDKIDDNNEVDLEVDSGDEDESNQPQSSLQSDATSMSNVNVKISDIGTPENNNSHIERENNSSSNNTENGIDVNLDPKSNKGNLFGGIVLGVILTIITAVGFVSCISNDWGGSSYDPEEEEKEFQEIFLKVQDNATDRNTATGEQLFHYSLIVRDSKVRDLLGLDMPQKQANILADDLQQLAEEKGDISALVKTGYDNIVKGIGKPIHGSTDSDSYYDYYKDVVVKDEEALSTGLKLLATGFKSQCYVEYYYSSDYPFLDNYAYSIDGEITTDNNYHAIGGKLNNFSRQVLVDYPEIVTQMDIISLRVRTHCETKENASNMLAGYLIHQEENSKYETYSADMPKGKEWLSKHVYLAVSAELLDMPELALAFEQRVFDKEGESAKQAYIEQKQALFKAYQTAFGDTIPKDKYMDK